MTRGLSVRDKLALIYTSAGSMRNVGALVGISHQKVSRILFEAYAPKSRVLSDPGLIRAVDLALSIHKDATRAQAIADGLPYNPQIPIFIERLRFNDGTPGDRVGALHTHWVSDALRDAWFTSMHSTGVFYAASVGSTVNLVIYNRRAEVDFRGKRDDVTRYNRATIKRKIEQQTINGKIYTKYTPMIQAFPIDAILSDVKNKMRQRHEPATGTPGTRLGDSYLLQIDTRKNGSDNTPKRPAKKRAATKRPKKK